MNTSFSRILFTGLLIFLSLFRTSYAQIRINEICPTNVNGILNSNGKYDDWIELHNAGGASVNLAGYGITDDPTKPFRFTFPNYTINAGQKVVVFASDSTSEVIVNHWEMAVDALTSWKYLKGVASIDTNWRNVSFNQTPWLSGNGGIGYADSDDGTTISVCASVMMRKTFNITDTSQILKAVLMMDYDDGFVAYLNGVEIARANLGTAGVRPAWDELAFSSHEAQMYQGGAPDSFFINPTLLKSALRNGTNVFAVETHNTTTTGSDLSSIPFLFFGMKTSATTFSPIPSWFHVPAVEFFNAKFKLSRFGETIYLYSPSAVAIDQVTYPSMEIDNSYCRKPDGAASWCYVSTPTPNASNNSSICYTGYAYIPVFSKQGGFYPTSQTISISNSTPGGVIRYTTNGNTPTATSPIYSSPISVPASKTIRARVFANGYLPSPIVTNTYIINASTHLPTFSITTDSLNLWDYNTGIYVMGPNAESTSPYKGANFWQDWEKPAAVEFWDRNKNLIVKFDADIKIFGNYSRAKDQKSFEIKLSDKYGTGEFNYPIYSDKPYVDKINNMELRNAGTDWNKVHFRDAYMERMLRNTYTGYLAAEPSVLYLNGAYWGVYQLNEIHDQHWIKNNFNLSKDEIDYMIEGGSSMDVKYGSDATFWTLYNYATTQNANNQAYYDYIDANLDLKNYTDYFVAETFYNNGDWIGDWTNNIKLWRPNAPGSKWRYLLYDLDMGLGYQGSVNDDRLKIARNPSAFSYSSEMFDAVLKNPTYKRYFINRYCDLLNTIFLAGNMDDYMESFEDTMAFDMPAHFAKWGSSTSTWQNNITSMMNFAHARPQKARDQIKSGFSLGNQVSLTIQTSPAGSGRIEISTITPGTLPWTGIYFKGNPVTITAIPNPGFTFDHWRSTHTINSNNPNQSVTYDFTGNDVITAYFTGSPAPTKLCVSELNYNSDSAYNAGDWIELHNYGTTSIDLSGWKLSDGSDNHKFVFPTGTVIGANGYLVLYEDSVKFKSQFPSVNNRLGPIGFNFGNAGDQIRLFDYADALFLNFYYMDVAPWPLQADGGGYTCELSSNTSDPNNGNSWFAGCQGGSPGRAYSPLLSIPVSIAGSTTFCSGGSVNLNATFVSGYTYQWKNNNVNIPGATGATYTATQSGSYTVQISNGGCATSTSPTVVTVVTQQPVPQVVHDSRCGPGVLTLHASASDTVFWYDAPSGGNLIATGDSLTTPMITQSATYYAVTGSNCQSNPVAVNATIIPLAAAPVTNDVSRCGPGIVTLTATDTAAVTWYNAPSGGGLVHSGQTFTTNTLNNDTSYYVEAGSVCPSPRIEVHVTINSTTEPVTTDDARCGPGLVNLTANSAAPVSWYNAATGGILVGTGLSFSPNIAATDTFYAEANSGCPSVRSMCIGIVNSMPAPPTASDVSVCSPGTVNLSATSTEQVYWYDAPSGGNLLSTGSNFTTPSISSTTTYYAAAGYDCLSSTVPVQAIISSPPSPPVSSNVNRCGPGSVTLIASSPELIYWYDAPTAGNLLATSDMFVTPTISTTTNYYAEAGNFCRSARIMVQAIIDAAPSAPLTNDVSRCGNGSVTLTASSPLPISWFTASSGGSPVGTGSTFTTPSLTSTTTYYVQTGTGTCISPRIPVQAIVGPGPSAPIVGDDVRCGPGTITFTAVSNATVSWYTVPSGGTPIATGLTFTTPSISTTTTYYAEANNGCISSRTPVDAIINSIPAPPTTSNVSRCDNGSVTLTASSPENIYWYTTAVGNSLVASGSNFTTPSLTSTTTYYVETGNTCRSSRIPVQAIINSMPSVPALTGGTNCGPGTVILTATGSGTISWYDVPAGGSPIATGLSFTTPSISSTTTYYAEAANGSCIGPRGSVQAIINSNPAAPVTTSASRCGSGTLTLTATSAGNVNWYTTPTGGSPVGSGLSFTTPVINTTTTYYAETVSGCSSTRTPAQAVINPQVSTPVTANVGRCGPGTVTLTAISPSQIFWYTDSLVGSPVGTGASYTTPYLTASTPYYLEAGTGACKSVRISVQAVINGAASTPVVNDTERCGPGTLVLTAQSFSTVNWFTTSSGGTSIGSGLTFTTPSLSSTTTYYAEAGPANCVSARVPVQAIINAVPSVPTSSNVSRCGAGSVTLTASSPSQMYWYANPSGGTILDSGSTYITPSINSTKNYYVSASNGTCLSSRIQVKAIINQIPSAPVTSDVSRCGPGVINLSATSPQTIYWYDAASGGNLLFTGAAFATPSLSSSNTYYVETGTTCRSARIPVNAIVATTPSVPAVFDSSRCGSGSIQLRAISIDRVNWYDAASGGTLLDTGLLFITPSISASTVYYADAGIGCNSARVPVHADIIPLPAVPLAADSMRCGTGALILHASSPETIYWYDSPVGGNLLSTGPDFTTPAISVTTTYYVETGNNCRSNRIAVDAIIGGSQVAVSNDGFNCGPGNVVLTASPVVANDVINWYDAPGGNIIATGTTFVSPLITSTTTYYVAAQSGCNGVALPVVAAIYSEPAINLGADTVLLLAGQTVVLDAGPGFADYHWSTGETTTTISVNTIGTYSVSVTDVNGCSASDIVVFIDVATNVSSVNGNMPVTVYPNPAHHELTIDFADAISKDVLVKLLSADGKEVRKEEYHPVGGRFSKSISLSGLAPGVYFLDMQNEDSAVVLKVLIQ